MIDDSEQYAATGGFLSAPVMLGVRHLHFIVELESVLLVLSLPFLLSEQRDAMCFILWLYRCLFDASSTVLLMAWSVPASDYASDISDVHARWLRILEYLCRVFTTSYEQVIRDSCVHWL